MIKYVKGDIFNSPSKIIVNTVNTVGVMGKGVALEYKNRYPEMFEGYKKLCEDGKLDVGMLYLWKKEEKWVLLFPTKKHWRNPSTLEYIELGLQKFLSSWDKLGANSIAFPRLGCGNGGLDWNEVRPLMEKYLKKVPMQIFIYVDNYKDPVPEHENITEMEKWLAGEYGLEGYEGFKVKLENFIKLEAPIVTADNIEYAIRREDDKVRIGDVLLEEMQLCNLWNWVRDTGVVEAKEIPSEYGVIAEAFLELMKKLKYVDRVFVSPDGKTFPAKPNAYQYVAE